MANAGELVVKLTAEDAQMQSAIKRVSTSLEGFAARARKVAAVGLSVFGGVSAVAAIKGSIAAMAEQELAEKKLEAAIGRRSKALLDQASALQKVTMFGDETVITAQAMIGAFVKSDDAIKAATKASADLSAATGMDLVSSASLVAKSLGSSTNALARYGVEVEGAVGSTQRLESLTTNIARLFGGQAAAQAKSLTGRLAILKNSISDIGEEVGAGLMPIINDFISAIERNRDAIRDAAVGVANWISMNKGAILSIGKLIAVAGGLLIVVPKLVAAFNLLALTPVGGVITIITAAMIALISATNEGKVAGVDLTAVTLSLASALGLTNKELERQQRLMNESKAIHNELVEAERVLAEAQTPKARLEAIEAVVKAQKDQLTGSKKAAEEEERILKDKIKGQQAFIDSASTGGSAGSPWVRTSGKDIERFKENVKSLTAELERMQKVNRGNLEAQDKHIAGLDKEAKAARSTIQASNFEAGAAKIAKLGDSAMQFFAQARNAAINFSDAIKGSVDKMQELRAEFRERLSLVGVEGLPRALADLEQQRKDFVKDAKESFSASPEAIAEINDRFASERDKLIMEFRKGIELIGADDLTKSLVKIEEERRRLIAEATAGGIGTTEMIAAINRAADKQRADAGASAAKAEKRTPSFVGGSDLFNRIQESLFKSDVNKQQLAVAEQANQIALKIVEGVKEVAAGVGRLAGGGGGVFGGG